MEEEIEKSPGEKWSCHSCKRSIKNPSFEFEKLWQSRQKSEHLVSSDGLSFFVSFFYYMKISNEDRPVFLQHKIWSCSKKTGTTLSMSRTIPMDLHVVGSFVIDVELGKTKTHFLLVRLIELGLNRQQPTSFTKVRESWCCKITLESPPLPQLFTFSPDV